MLGSGGDLAGKLSAICSAGRMRRSSSGLPPYRLHQKLDQSLNVGWFALATAQARKASVASFDRRVRRALPKVGLTLAAELS
jgi:hypothetical protein